MLYDKRWEKQVTKQKWRQVLLDAADIIEKDGWCKGLYVSYDQGGRVTGHCAIGAIRSTNFDEEDVNIAIRRLNKKVINDAACFNIPEWNDAQSDASVVIQKLREVATT